MAKKLFSLDEIEEIVCKVYEQFYENTRRGAFDFPEKEDWVADSLILFRRNNPELFGFVWDELNEDWVFNDTFGGGVVRMPYNKK